MDKSSRKIPLAFFAYNRPEHTVNALHALSQCNRLEDFEFYFFSDGPRDAEDQAEVAEVRHLLAMYAEKFSAEVTERPNNFGVARSIVDGVNSLCDTHGRVVVLEDDLVVAPDFLHFMASALGHYEDTPEVMQVGACTLAPPENLETDTFLLPVTTTWGWGTWKRAWEKFSLTPEGWPESRSDEDWLSLFQVGGAGNYVAMLEDCLAKRNDSWGILWWYAVSRHSGMVAYPSNNLVRNDGFDGSGVHCGVGRAMGEMTMRDSVPRLPEAISFPQKLQFRPEDFELLKTVIQNLTSVPDRVQSRANYLFEKIRERVRYALN